MSTATLDENLFRVLATATDRVVIQSRDGEVLGYFQPVPAVRTSPLSEDELRAIMQNKGECLPLEEVWKRIGAK